MGFVEKINDEIKTAMKAKDRDRLNALRAIKSAILLETTKEGSDGSVSEEASTKILQKMLKQRKDSAEIYQTQGREESAQEELSQADVIQSFLPEPMSMEELESALKEIISQVGASGPSDMGKVMGMASSKLAGKADGKTISQLVKKLLVG